MTELLGISPHDRACAQIAAWRGRCLDLFARGESVVAGALESAKAKHEGLKIKHLASQRVTELAGVLAAEHLTTRQRAAVERALEEWVAVENRRAFLAHGVSLPLFDKDGSWHVQLDFTDYRTSRSERCRWNLSAVEADEFEAQLKAAFKSMATELGQFRKRAST